MTDHTVLQAAAYRRCCVNLDDLTICERSEGGGKEGASSVSKGTKGINVILFGEEMKQQVTFQLCEVADEGMLHALAGTKRLASCTPSDGWYPNSAMIKLRESFREVTTSPIFEYPLFLYTYISPRAYICIYPYIFPYSSPLLIRLYLYMYLHLSLRWWS